MSNILWQPSPERVAQANLTAFIREVQTRDGADVDDYESLWRWSVARREEFWPAVWRFCDLQASRVWYEVFINGDAMPGTQWFPGARLNYAENLLRASDRRPAIVFWNEQGLQRRLSYAELRREVAQLAAGLRARGVGPGTRVAALLPNLPETVIVLLAAASLGAVFCSASPDFGASAVVDRFGQIEPTVLFAVDGYVYGGRAFDILPRVREIAAQLPSLRHTIIVPYLHEPAPLDDLPGGTHWRDALDPSATKLDFAQLPFDHPLAILFSSGTTGVPKCIIHSAGGTLLQHQKEHVLHTDLTPNDRLFYFTTCGWMMWNWLVSGLATGGEIVLYDGSPMMRDGRILFNLAEAERITAFGVSAKYLSAIEKAGLAPRETHDLNALRTILSTGSPLAPESFDYVYQKVKSDVCLASISGGTDIVSCFALGNPIGPVRRGELQTRGLGMRVEVFNEAGKPVVGEKGELVCAASFPSMPLGFWNDPDGSKYRAAYFERFPGVWHHGDYCELRPQGGMVIYGRSDAVLNPGGVRIGTAEIYRLVEQLPEVIESLVVGQDWQGDVRIVLFVRLADGITLDEPLRETIRGHIRRGATPRHVPARILSVTDIPRTKSGKLVELAVRNAIHHQPILNLDALANPAALEQFCNREELEE